MSVSFFKYIVLLLMVSIANADYFDGNGLIELMDSTRNINVTMYRGYVAGVQDSYNGVSFCVPYNVRLNQSSAIVSEYLRKHPKRWHEPAKFLIIDAMKEAFACEN